MAAVWIGAEHLVDTHGTDDHDPTGQASLIALLASIELPAWYADAACHDKPVDWFFPERGQSTDDAKAVCAACDALEACRSYADSQGPALIGIWAGESKRARKKRRENERRRDARELGIVA